jgi:hypothetical protein
MVATMNVGCRVEGSHGEFLPAACNPDGTQASRQKRARLQETILEAKGEKRWLVRFDNGIEKECPSVTLKMLGGPRYNSTVASAPVLISAPAASAPVLASAPEALAPTAVALMASAPVFVTSAPAASAPTAVAPEASAPVLVAPAPAASAPTEDPLDATN